MTQDDTLFQYCQKIVVLNQKLDSVLLARRKGEADYDGTFSFVGGKLETKDKDLIAGLAREKDEELGPNVQIQVLPNPTYNEFFIKKDGKHMVLPHYAAKFKSGTIKLSSEYSEYRWVKISELDILEPKIPNIPGITIWALNLLETVPITELVEI